MADTPGTVIDTDAALASRRHLVTRVVIYGILTIFAAVYVIPLLVVIANSFRDLPEIAKNGLIAFPQSFRVSAWGEAWST